MEIKRNYGKDMRLEILLSCMDQSGRDIVKRSGITGDVLVVAQHQPEDHWTMPTENGTARGYSMPDHGLTKSRNFAIAHSEADICLLCDDDERFVPNYEKLILSAYTQHPEADVVVFKMTNLPSKLPNRVCRLRFPQIAKVSSWQISFRRTHIIKAGIWFDEFMGAGTGNGAEEELKFLMDCQKAGMYILYMPVEIASVAQKKSSWFNGFNREFFINRGSTTRYILGWPLAFLYAVYYILAKQRLYRKYLTPWQAFSAIMRGMYENRITKQVVTAKQAKQKAGAI